MTTAAASTNGHKEKPTNLFTFPVRSTATNGTTPPHCSNVPGSSYLVTSPSSLVSPEEEEGQKWEKEPEVEQLLKMQEQGRIEPLPVDLPKLPPNSFPAMYDVSMFFCRVYGLRLWGGDTRPVPFSVRWVAANLHLPRATTWRAIKALVSAGVLVQGETLPGRQKLGTHTYAPGRPDAPLEPDPKGST